MLIVKFWSLISTKVPFTSFILTLHKYEGVVGVVHKYDLCVVGIFEVNSTQVNPSSIEYSIEILSTLL